jgi:hypothetical protein
MAPDDRQELRSALLASVEDGQLPPRVADLFVVAADYLVGRASDDDFVEAIRNLDADAHQYFARTATGQRNVPLEETVRAVVERRPGDRG